MSDKEQHEHHSYLPWKTIIFTAETNTTTRTIRVLGHEGCFKTNGFVSELESLLLQVVGQKSIGFIFAVAELGVIVNLSNGTLAWFTANMVLVAIANLKTDLAQLTVKTVDCVINDGFNSRVHLASEEERKEKVREKSLNRFSR